MDYELVFSGAGILAMFGWLMLLISPWTPIWSDRVAGLTIPVVLAAAYLAIVIFVPTASGGFGSFAEISELFSQPQALMAGWIHFLAFDLLIGAWICRKARAEEIRFWFVLPCLPITFFLGPAGYLLFSIIRGSNSIIAKRSLERL